MNLQNYLPNTLIHAHIKESLVPVGASLFQALVTMEKAKRFGLPPGLVLVVDAESRLKGVVTDGDVRRALMQGLTGQVPVEDVMVRTPVHIRTDIPVTGVLDEVRRQLEARGKQSIIKYPVLVDEDSRVLGIIDLSRLMLANSWHWDKIIIIGLGYVGLTLAVSLAETRFQVVGWETDPLIRAKLQKGIPHIHERGLDSLLSTQLADEPFVVANSDDETKDCHVYIVTVSTPFQDGKPNLTYLKKAIEMTTSHLQAGDLIILRSTVPVRLVADW